MNMDSISPSLNLPFIHTIESAITQEELGAALSEIPDVTHDKTTKKPIFPVPDDAAEFNFKLPIFGGAPAHIWAYHNEFGALLGYMARWNFTCPETGIAKKEYRPVCYCELENGKRAWRSVGMPVPRPLYRLHEIIADIDRTILINEGEKSADAAQLLFGSAEYVATTPMHGAKSPEKSDWGYVKDRSVIIVTDADAAGREFGERVYHLCRQAGAKTIQHLPCEAIGKFLLSENGIANRAVPKKYDLADSVSEGWTAELLTRFDMHNFITPYISEDEISALNNSIGGMFRLTRKGVEYAKEVKNPDTGEKEIVWTWFCSYLAITHQARDVISHNWGRVLDIIDNDGKKKEYILPMAHLAGDGVYYREELLSMGVRMAPRSNSHLHNYITTSNPKERARCVSKTGWCDNAYVLPHIVIGQGNKERIVLQTGSPIKPQAMHGSLEGWKSTIGTLAKGNNRLMVIIALAFTAPLLELLGEENFGLHLYGSSSIGKTTALYVAQSVWGIAINSWRTTDNAAESLAKGANDSLLLLDELSQVDSYAADAMAYMLGNGVGKARSKRDGNARAVEKFRLVFLSSGEVKLSSKMQEAGKKTKAGQTVRFIEIPADAGKGMGIFEDLHDFSDSGLAVEFKRLASLQSGRIIIPFIEELCLHSEAIIKSITNARKFWVAQYVQGASDGQVVRVAQKFALIAAVGELAIAQGLLPWEPNSASAACAVLFQDWIQQRGGITSHEIAEAETRLRLFIAQHGSSRFEAPWGSNTPTTTAEGVLHASDQRIIQRAGFKKLNEHNEWEFYIIPAVFEAEIIAGQSAHLTKQYLAERGLLKRDPEGKYTCSIRVPGYKSARFYFITSAVMESEEPCK